MLFRSYSFEIKSNIPPITKEYSKCIAQIIADANANPRPIAVQKFADKPVEANTVPIFCKVGFRPSLKLLSIGYQQFVNNLYHYKQIKQIHVNELFSYKITSGCCCMIQ